MKFYIDVDDVCADFRGHAITCGVPPWDGVFYANHPSTWTDAQKAQVAAVDKLCARDDFWRGIPVAPLAFEIIAACAVRGDSFLLTAYPMGEGFDTEMVRAAKMWWTTTKLHFPEQRVIICPRKEKVRHATGGFMDDDGAWNPTPNVLIDDAAKNVNEWTAAGGIGILHDPQNPAPTLDAIRALT